MNMGALSFPFLGQGGEQIPRSKREASITRFVQVVVPEKMVRIVNENCRTLKFKKMGFEEQ